MHTLDFLALRHTGFEPSQHPDVAIRRLKCYYKDVYRGINSTELELTSPLDSSIITCRFSDNQVHPELLALASDDGRVAVQNTSQEYPLNSSIKGLSAHHENAIFDIAWMPDELKIITASGDHTAKLWNISNSCLIPISVFQSHTGSVKTAAFRPDDKNIFATGARDGAIFIWDVRDRNRKPDNSIFNGHRVDSSNGVKHRPTFFYSSPAEGITGLIFQDTNTLISCAAGDGLIKIWDLRKNYTVRKNQPSPRHILSYGGGSGRNGFSSLAVCPARLKLYVNCIDDVVYTYNLSSYKGHPIAQFHGHQNSSYYVKNCVSPDGRYLASGSSNGIGYIWRTDQPGTPFIKLKGHTQEVTCITWSKRDEPCIVTASEDSSHRVWRVGLEHPGDNDNIELCGKAEVVETINESIDENRESTQCASRMLNEENRITLDNTLGDNVGAERSTTTNTRSGPCVKRTRDLTSSESRGNGQMKNTRTSIEESYEPSTKRSNIENQESRELFNSTLPGMQPPFSPTLNLPNFVTEGNAPHLISHSPKKSRDRIDWLTRIRRTQYGQKLRKSESDEVTNADVTPVRRRSRSRSFERQHMKSPGLSLLNFFKVESPPGKIRNECTRGKTE